MGGATEGTGDVSEAVEVEQREWRGTAGGRGKGGAAAEGAGSSPSRSSRGAGRLQGGAGVGPGSTGTWLQLDLQLADRTVLAQQLHLPVQGVQPEGGLQAGEGSTCAGTDRWVG